VNESGPLIIGHRGASRDAPENTLAAFRLAFAQGADGIEADFRLTRDRRLVCMHDATTGRTAGADMGVAQASLDELRLLDVGAWRGRRWSGERIPTLEEVLAIVPAGKRAFIELKCGAEALPVLQEILRRPGMGRETVRLLTFDAGVARALATGLPEITVCLNVGYAGVTGQSPDEIVDTLARCGAAGLSAEGHGLEARTAGAVRATGRELFAWTVDSVSEARRLRGLGVDALMTNRPGRLREGLLRDGRWRVSSLAEALSPARLRSRLRLYAGLLRIARSHLRTLRLLRHAEREFEADYRAFFVAGETRGREVGRPILIRGASRELGVLLVHGFLAAPRELAELAGFLGQRGFWVYVARVRGHGTSADDLARRGAQEWRESVDVGFAALSGVCERVVVGGFSFGGGLALDCAARHEGRVAGVFAVCPPMRLQDLSSRFAPAVDTWNRLMDFLNLENGKKEFVETFPEHPDINYRRLPVASLAHLERFMQELEPRLPSITVPALIVQSSGDPVVDPAGSRRLFELLGSPRKEYRLLGLDRHGILAGPGADLAHAAIGEFVERIRAQG
jgi:glycerophosphoryl diester phosphodiesterase/esterase/lipase